MDFEQMVRAHMESGAGVTVSGIRQPKELANQFGVIQSDPDDPTMISEFLEKPSEVQGLKDSPDEVLVSMGNYVFNADVLMAAVTEDADHDDSDHDMGGDVIPAFVDRGDARVYDMSLNEVPGAREQDRLYWRDVGTIDSFYEAHMDLISFDPIFNLYNAQWPIFLQQWNTPPAKFVQDANGNPGRMADSLVSLGCVIQGGTVVSSILSPGVRLLSGARVEQSVVFERCIIGEGATVHRAILDKGVRVAPGASVGVDPAEDRARGYTVTASGITVVAKGLVVT
jgi:glucose-1-phosphate adenylyltransferase